MLVALIAHARAGTSYLRSLLNTHPAVHFYTEALYPTYWEHGFFQYWLNEIQTDPRALFIQNDFHEVFRGYMGWLEASRSEPVIGVDLKIPQIDDLPTIHRILRDSDARIVHLVRRNTFRGALSQRVMLTRVESGERDVHGRSTPATTRVRLDPHDLLALMRYRVNSDRRIGRFYAACGERCLELEFESFEQPDGRAAGLASVFEHLGVAGDSASLETTLAPQNPFPYTEVIENHEEVWRVLRETEFASQVW